MPIIDSVIRTLSCDVCDKKVLFEKSKEQETVTNPANAWLMTARTVQTVDGRNRFYCSDVCEVKGVETGKHNPPQPKIIEEGTAAGVAAAAQDAAQKHKTDDALRSGTGGKIQLA